MVAGRNFNRSLNLNTGSIKDYQFQGGGANCFYTPPSIGWCVALRSGTRILAFGILVGMIIPGFSSADMGRPVYSSGDRWEYVTEYFLKNFTGDGLLPTKMEVNISGTTLLEVKGLETLPIQGKIVEVVRVRMESSGTTKGNFTMVGPTGNVSGNIAGSFKSHGEDLWEAESYESIQSNLTAHYEYTMTMVDISITYIMSMSINTTNNIVQDDFNYPLGVGNEGLVKIESAVNATIIYEYLGMTTTSTAKVEINTTTNFKCLRTEQVIAEAGTFDSYIVEAGIMNVATSNQTLVSTLDLISSYRSYELIYYSEKVGNYVKRETYNKDDEKIGEMRLKSYSYRHGEAGLYLFGIHLFLWIPIWIAIVAGIAAWFMLLMRKRKPAKEEEIEEKISTPSPPRQ